MRCTGDVRCPHSLIQHACNVLSACRRTCLRSVFLLLMSPHSPAWHRSALGSTGPVSRSRMPWQRWCWRWSSLKRWVFDFQHGVLRAGIRKGTERRRNGNGGLVLVVVSNVRGMLAEPNPLWGDLGAIMFNLRHHTSCALVPQSAGVPADSMIQRAELDGGISIRRIW